MKVVAAKNVKFKRRRQNTKKLKALDLLVSLFTLFLRNSNYEQLSNPFTDILRTRIVIITQYYYSA